MANGPLITSVITTNTVSHCHTIITANVTLLYLKEYLDEYPIILVSDIVLQ